MDLLLIFFNQYLVVFMLGFQSLMVRDHNYIGAMVGSTVIGVCQFYVFAMIVEVSKYGLFSEQALAFIVAGPVAIGTAMKTQPYVHNWLVRRKNDKAFPNTRHPS